jgi:hypothetical protein
MNKKIINRYIKRGSASIGKWMGLLLLPLLLFSSCVDDSVTSGSTTSSDSTQVRLTFNLQQQTSLTRSLSPTGTSESQVDNINVLIFDGNNNNSKLIGSTYQTYGTSQTSSFTVTVPTRVASSCTIYAVANWASSNLTDVATINDFKQKYILMSSASTLGNGSNMVMFGQTSGVTISATAASNTPGITLTRLGSKVAFNITPATGITITGYQLCHVPMSSYITNATDSTHFNPSATYGDFTSVSGLGSTTKVSPSYYMYENLVGRKSGATSFFSRGKANAPTDASYLMIYAARADSGWHAVYRVYLGGTGMSDYTNYNVPRNYSYTYNINIDGADEADVRVRCLPNIGDYYYSDGTFGASASPTGKTAIGVVFSNAISATDSVKGWTHGYAMALTNAASNASWASSTYVSTIEFGASNYVNTVALMESDMDGYTHSQTIKNKSGYSSTNYPAFYYALNYGTASVGGTKYAAPSNSSGWYLPSQGQWYFILTKIGGINMPLDNGIASSGTGYWKNPASFNAAAAINVYLSSVTGSDQIDCNSSNARWFWSSSEWGYNSACIINFSSNSYDGYLYLNLTTKTTANIDNRIRSVIAF